MNKIINFIFAAYNLFIKRIGICCVIAIQLCSCVILLNYSICEVRSIINDICVLDTIHNKNTFVIMAPREIYISKGKNYLNISDLDGEYSIGDSSKATIQTDVGTFNLYIYNSALLDNILIPLKKGSWNNIPQIIDNIIYYPIIINKENNKYKYGDKIQIQLSDKTILNTYIAGILGKEQQFIDLSVTSTNVIASHLIDSCEQENIMFFCNSKMYPKMIYNNTFDYYTKFIFFDENITQDALNNNYNILKNQVYVYNVSEILENSNNVIAETLGYYMPLFFVQLMVSFVGVISFVIVLVSKNSQFFSLSFLCGARKRDNLFIIFICLILIALLSLMFAFLIISMFSLIGIFTFSKIFSPINYFLSSFIYILVFIFGLFTSCFIFKKNKDCKIRNNRGVL